MDKHYSVIFNGDVVSGSDIDEVKAKLAALLKEEPTNVEKLFSGQSYVIKQNGDLKTCEKIRRAFIGAGAVCHIQGPDIATDKPGAEEDTLNVLSTDTPSERVPEKKPKREWKTIFNSILKSLLSSKKWPGTFQTKMVSFWQDGSESVKLDVEMGGVQSLIGNKFVTISFSAISLFVVLLVVGFTYESEAMPATEANFDKILNHIEFIESAFTNEELESMTRNRSDFLDYVLVDPIRKMGYDFEPSIKKICKDFLDGDFDGKKREKVNVILKITTHEREELFKHGIISESTKNKLDKVASTVQAN